MKRTRMDDCCETTSTLNTPSCPGDGSTTKSVERITVESLVRDEERHALRDEPYFFCEAPECEVVYVSASREHVIAKSQLKARVGIKETVAPIPVCYCFGYTREDIVADVRAYSDTDIQRIITGRVKAGDCHCETANPSGRCCLGDVARAIKAAHTQLRLEERKPDADC